MQSREVRSVAAIALVYALRMLGLFMVLPVFVLLGDDLAGATPQLLGLAMGAYGLSQALLQIPFGLLSDRFGRKPLIVFGLLVFAAGSVLAALSDSVYGVIAGRFLQGAGAVASVLLALVSDLTRESVRTRAMAAIGLSIGISFSLALVLGPLIGQVSGLAGIFWVTAAMALAGLAVLLTLVPTPTVSTHHRDTQPALSQLGDVIRRGRLLRLDLGIFVLHLVLTAAFLLVPRLLQDKAGLPSDAHWWVYLSVMGVSFFAMVPFIIIGEKQRRMKAVMLGAVSLLLLATALLDRAGSLGGLWGVLFAFFMAFNLLEATLPSMMSKEAPAGSKGTAMGVYSTSQFLGAFTGGALGGTMLQYGGASALSALMLGALGLWWLVVATMPEPRYATSFVVRLKALDPTQTSRAQSALSAVAGVEEVVVVAALGEAYLKVDKRTLDESALRRCEYVAELPSGA